MLSYTNHSQAHIKRPNSMFHMQYMAFAAIYNTLELLAPSPLMKLLNSVDEIEEWPAVLRRV